MTRAWVMLLCLLAAYPAGGLAVSREERRAVPVVIQAVVEDGKNQPISDLGPGEVEVVIDGQSATGVSVRCGAPPLTLVVLIDVTASVEVELHAHNGAIRKATERLLATLGDGDRVRVGAVAATPALSPAFTSDRGKMAEAVHQVLDRKDRERYGPSPIWDALDLAITALAPEPGRRAVILFTDGRGSGNRLGYAEMAGHAVAAGVAVNVVSPFDTTVIPQSQTLGLRVRPQISLGRLADITGGLLVSDVPEWKRYPDRVLLTLLPRIRSSCDIRFAPGIDDGEFHRLDVRVRRAGAVVHAPQGFLARKPR